MACFLAWFCTSRSGGNVTPNTRKRPSVTQSQNGLKFPATRKDVADVNGEKLRVVLLSLLPTRLQILLERGNEQRQG